MWAPTAEEMLGIHSVILERQGAALPLVQKGCRVDPPLEVRRGLLDPERDEACTSKDAVQVVDLSRPWDADVAEACGIVNVSVERKGPWPGASFVGRG